MPPKKVNLFAYLEDEAALEEVLSRGMVNADQVDSDLNTPLHVACKKNLLGAATILLRHGATVDASCNSMRAIHYAILMAPEICKVLLACDACIFSPNPQGISPLQLVEKRNDLQLAQLFAR